MSTSDDFGARSTLDVGGKSHEIFRLDALQSQFDVARLPYSLKVLLENLLRNGEDDGVRALAQWVASDEPSTEIAYRPARVLMQDFTGVPAIVDLAAMRDAMEALGGDPTKINPLVPVELVIDHSIQVDVFAERLAFQRNAELEFQRNRERYAFLRWGQGAFDNFAVVPPNTGICHQVNLEYLGRVVMERDGQAFCDTLVGTDSHTTMINGLGVLGWGVGGIEAEAAMLGQPVSMLIPQVVGFRLTGALPEGSTATDLVLTVTQMLRERGVVGKFVEFYGPGLATLPLADRATIGNMAPEYGATCGIFPVDAETLRYLEFSGRPPERVELVEAYCREQGLFHEEDAPDAVYSDTLELDLGEVVPSLAGPKRPQDRVPLTDAASDFKAELAQLADQGELNGYDESSAESFPASDPPTSNGGGESAPAGRDHDPSPDAGGHGEQAERVGGAVATADAREGLDHGSVVIAAITSCTNTSNPSVMLGAGLLAKKAIERGLVRRPWVKTSLAPGSKVVTEYLDRAGLTEPLSQLGFDLVGYGCTTCIGNSGPLPEEISREISERDLVVASVLSGNRNFEGRIHPEVKMNYLASPPLCVAYALAGRMDLDVYDEPLQGDVYLRDIWPSQDEVSAAIEQAVHSDMFRKQLRRGVRGRRDLAGAGHPGGRPLRLGRRLHLRQAPALLRGHGRRAGGGLRPDRGRPRAGAAGRQRHDRPHLPGGRDQEGLARRRLPARPRRRAARLQLLRVAPRQPRGDDARHVREHPPAQPARARDRGRLHGQGRRADDDLRRGHGVRGRGRAAVRAGRQGVRLGLVARLGGEGAAAAGRALRAGAVVRAHPPLATSSAWASCRCSSPTASRSSRSASRASRRSTSRR